MNTETRIWATWYQANGPQDRAEAWAVRTAIAEVAVAGGRNVNARVIESRPIGRTFLMRVEKSADFAS